MAEVEVDENTALLGHKRGPVTEQPVAQDLRQDPGRVSSELSKTLTESMQSNASIISKTIPGCRPASTNTQKEGCVMCRTETPVANFSDLKPGDHIVMRGQICCLGRAYNHHAIVTRVEPLGDHAASANIHVVDVACKGLEFVGCMCQGGTCCCCCLRCCRCRYPILEHRLMDRTWRKADIKTQKMCRVDYKWRRNDEDTTMDIARKFCRIAVDSETEYCVLFQNCEHFTNACVNGQDTPDRRSLKKTLSIQSYRCFWRIIVFVCWLLLGVFYAIDFYVYATFAAKDEDFDIFPSELHNFIRNNCYNSHDCMEGLFDTTCYWKALLLFIVLFLIVYTAGHCFFYQPLYRRGLICEQCLRTTRLDGFTRILALVLVEAINVSIEDPVYNMVAGLQTKRSETIMILLAISFMGALLTYSVSSVITWILGMCCIPTCSGAYQFTQYFEFRGCAYVVECLVRAIACCLRRIRQHVVSTEGASNVENVKPIDA